MQRALQEHDQLWGSGEVCRIIWIIGVIGLRGVFYVTHSFLFFALLLKCKPVYSELMKTLYSFLFVVVSGFWATLALAADPFTVAGVPVDAQGDNAIAAQTTAISEGQALAADILINRLTLRSERATKRLAPLEPEAVAKMIRALEIANEKRSGNRYLGDITVAFNPSQVQQVLRDRGLNMISTQSRGRLVLPVLGNSPLWSNNQWSAAWRNTAFGHSLTPVRGITPGEGNASIVSASDAMSVNIDALRRAGQRYGVDQVLIAVATPGAGGVDVRLTDVALDTGQKRDIGRVSARDYNQAAWAAIEALEENWKTASVSLAENAETMTVSVLYRSHNDWLTLQEAINGSAQIQDARLDALSKDGALMTLTFGGDMDRLRGELGFKGVTVRSVPNLGVVLTRTGRY